MIDFDKDYNKIPAFPTKERRYGEFWYFNPGMTLLDYFAGQVISNLNCPAEEAIENAYVVAAAMIEERKKYIK